MLMAFICKIDVRKTLALYGNARLKCGNKNYERLSLFDTGAIISHMSYGFWLDMGLDEVIFNDNPPLMDLLGIKSKDDLTFDTLPMTAVITRLGNDVEIKAYEFCLDVLTLGIQSLSYSPIKLEKITVRLIDSPKWQFLVGWNVLKYLDTFYRASKNEAIYTLNLTAEGRGWLETDRRNRVANYMTSRFSYLAV